MIQGILLFILLGLFVAMVFLNVYFRARVLKMHKVLAQNKVEFGAAHLFNKAKMEAEIMPRYPHLRKEIEAFVNNLQYSIRMATVLVVIITLFGAVLMYFRKQYE
jgi:hypothetical protein